TLQPRTAPVRALVEVFLETWQLDRTSTQWPKPRAEWVDDLLESARQLENQFCVEIRPLVVATIQRLPQRTIESILPRAGTVSPCVALQTLAGPSKTTVPPTTSRIVQPSIVIGLVSGIAMGLGKIFARSWTPR